MNLVQQAIMQGNLGRANALLEQHIPKPGEIDRRSWEWHYFRREAQSDALAVLTGHVSRVQAVAISADGRRLASAGWDSVRLWDIARRQELASHLETNFFGSIAFSPDGKWLVVGGRSVVQLDGFTLKPIATFPHDSKAPATVALSPDGTILAVADVNSVRLFKTRPISEVGELAPGVSTVKGALAFFPDGNSLAVGGEDGNIMIWDVRTNERKVQLPSDGKRIKAIAISPDGSILAAPNGRRRLTLWNLQAKPIPSEIPVELSFAGPIAFSPDGHSLAIADSQKIMIWDIDKQSIVASHQGHTYAVECVAFSPANGLLISGSRDTTLMLWKGGSAETAVDHVRLKARDNLETFLHCPKNETIGIFDSERTLSIWDSSALKEKTRLQLPLPAFLGAIAPDERSVALVSYSFSEGFSLQLIKDLETNATVLLDKSPDPIEKVCFSLNRQLLAAASADGVVKVWDVFTNRLLTRIQTSVGIAGSLAFFPDGKALVSGGAQDWTVRVWQLPSGRQVAAFQGHQGPVSAIEVSSDQRKIITASFDGTAKIWSLASNTLVATFKGQLLNLLSVDLSDDGRRLATGAGDGTVKLWDVTSQREVAALNTHVESVWKVAFSSDGRKLMATSADRISCWNSAPR